MVAGDKITFSDFAQLEQLWWKLFLGLLYNYGARPNFRKSCLAAAKNETSFWLAPFPYSIMTMKMVVIVKIMIECHKTCSRFCKCCSIVLQRQALRPNLGHSN